MLGRVTMRQFSLLSVCISLVKRCIAYEKEINIDIVSFIPIKERNE